MVDPDASGGGPNRVETPDFEDDRRQAVGATNVEGLIRIAVGNLSVEEIGWGACPSGSSVAVAFDGHGLVSILHRPQWGGCLGRKLLAPGATHIQG